MNLATKLSAARFMACRRAPYFTGSIMGLVPRTAPGFGSFAVSEDMVMIYDPAVVDAWSVAHLATVVEHEVYHIIRDHAGRARALGLHTPDQLHRWNIAADAESNDDLRGGGREFPIEAIYPETLVKFGVPADRCVPGLLAEDYYAMLLAAEQSKDQQGGDQGKDQQGGDQGKDQQGNGQQGKDQQGNGQQDITVGNGQQGNGQQGNGQQGNGQQGNGQQGNGQQGNGQDQGSVGSGRCGGCAGNPSADEKALTTDESGKGIGRSDVDLARMRQQVAAEVERTVGNGGQGGVPGGLLRWAETRRKSNIRWQDKLRRVARRAVQRGKGLGDYTYGRPHRRYAAMRRRNARTAILPATYRPMPRIAIALDTSASMGTKDVEIALGEVEAVLKHTANDVTFIACDSKVRSYERISSAREASKLIVGGGGTAFRPVFDALERDKQRPDILVFVTDGQVYDLPERAPQWAHVIWVLVGNYKRKPCDWGEHIMVS